MELSLGEIRNFMLLNGGKVTNHTLVKHFKEFLTHPQTQNEARKQFKTIVNMLASIKTEEKADGTFEKYLILKPKYFNECPAEGDSLNQSMSMNFSVMPMSPSSTSLYSEYDGSSPSRQPPPYRAPPQVSSPNQPPPPPPLKLPQLEHDTGIKYRDCIDEYKTAVTAIRKQTGHEPLQKSLSMEAPPPAVPPRRRSSGSMDQVIPGQVGPVERPILESDNASMYDTLSRQSVTGEMVVQEMFDLAKSESESKLSVKEATKKFNQIASEEEKIATPSPKRITDRKVPEHQNHHHTNGDLGASHLDTENLISHPKAREWMVSAARANYQELSKLANEYPNLVRLQDPTNTALHWAAKHGNGDVVKLIAGTYKADVNARTNGGYTPLHLAMQFGRDEVFDLLQNVYKADRNLTDWSGKKPLDYSKQKTTVSASTYSKIKARKKQSEKDLGFLRIGSLNVRVKKTTEAFSSLFGHSTTQRHGHPPQPPLTRHRNNLDYGGFQRATVPIAEHIAPSDNDPSQPDSLNGHLHKTWNSVDNISYNQMMPPPKSGSKKRQRQSKQRSSDDNQCHSMPTTPSQHRANIHSSIPNDDDDETDDSAFGFDSNWQGGSRIKPTYI